MSKRVIEQRKLRKQSIGDMREVISLEERGIAAPLFDTDGFTEDYTNVRQVWAKIETSSGFKKFDGVDVSEIATHKFTIRYRDDVTAQTRIRYKDNLYKIINVDDMERRQEYLLLHARLEGDDTLEANQ